MTTQTIEALSNGVAIAAADIGLFGADARRAAMDGVQIAGSNFVGGMVESTIGSFLPSSFQHFSNMIATAGIYTAADQFLENCPFDNMIAKFFYAAGANALGNTFIAPVLGPAI